jgi:alpha-tubulin suppressor-like RCC1 family protein
MKYTINKNSKNFINLNIPSAPVGLEAGSLYTTATWINNVGLGRIGNWTFVESAGTLKNISNANQNGRASIGSNSFFLAPSNTNESNYIDGIFTFSNEISPNDTITFNANYSWNGGLRAIEFLAGTNAAFRFEHGFNGDALVFKRAGQADIVVLDNAFNQAITYTLQRFTVNDDNQNILTISAKILGTSTNLFSASFTTNQLGGSNNVNINIIKTYVGGILDAANRNNYGIYLNNIQVTNPATSSSSSSSSANFNIGEERGGIYTNFTWVENAGLANIGNWSFVDTAGTNRNISNSNQNGRTSVGAQAFLFAPSTINSNNYVDGTLTLSTPLIDNTSVKLNANYAWNGGVRGIEFIGNDNSLFRIEHKNGDNIYLATGVSNDILISNQSYNEAFSYEVRRSGTYLNFYTRNFLTQNLLFQTGINYITNTFNLDLNKIKFYVGGVQANSLTQENYGLFVNNIQTINYNLPVFETPIIFENIECKISKIISIENHNLSLSSNGYVSGWGNSQSGQLNIPNSVQYKATGIAGGIFHSLALLKDGTVTAWGNNTYNQRNVPSSIQGQVTEIAAAGAHSLALLKNGSVTGWGLNTSNQISISNSIQGQVTGIAASYFNSFFLLKDGSITGYGEPSLTNIFSNFQNNVTGIFAGYTNLFLLLKNGLATGFGNNDYNQLNIPNSIQGYIRDITIGGESVYFTLQNNTVTGIGNNTYSQLEVPQNTQGSIKYISAGYSHAISINNDQSITGWGANQLNQIEIPTGINCTGISSSSSSSSSSFSSSSSSSSSSSVFEPFVPAENPKFSFSNKYKYARVYMSGFRSAPLEFNVENIVLEPVDKIIVKNITLFSKYKFELDERSITLTGVDNINNSIYSGNIFNRNKGFVKYRDIGKTDTSGIFYASGITTGKLIPGQTFFDSKNRPVIPIEENYEIRNIDAKIKPSNPNWITGNYLINATDLHPKDFTKDDSSSNITLAPFAIYRENVYTGVYGGIQNVSDNFYDPSSFKVSFNKKINYIVTGNNVWENNQLVVSQTSRNPGEIPGINILNKVLAEGSGYVIKSGYENVVGFIPSVGILRNNVSGFNYITGKLTGFVDASKSGEFIFNQIVTGFIITGSQNQATGYKNAFNYLNYNNPQELDGISIEDNNRGETSSFSYSQESFFTAPSYFKSIEDLNNIINSGREEYGVRSELDLPNNRLKLSPYFASGSSGNNIYIRTFGSSSSPSLQTGSSLLSGIDFYSRMYFTGLLSGFLFEIIKATGYMTGAFSEFITGNISGIVGYRSFNQSGSIWSISVSDNGVSYRRLNSQERKTLTGINYTGDFIDDPTNNIYNIIVGYNNQGLLNNSDIAQLKIGLNNSIYKYINITGQQI